MLPAPAHTLAYNCEGVFGSSIENTSHHSTQLSRRYDRRAIMRNGETPLFIYLLSWWIYDDARGDCILSATLILHSFPPPLTGLRVRRQRRVSLRFCTPAPSSTISALC